MVENIPNILIPVNVIDDMLIWGELESKNCFVKKANKWIADSIFPLGMNSQMELDLEAKH